MHGLKPLQIEVDPSG